MLRPFIVQLRLVTQAACNRPARCWCRTALWSAKPSMGFVN